MVLQVGLQHGSFRQPVFFHGHSGDKGAIPGEPGGRYITLYDLAVEVTQWNFYHIPLARVSPGPRQGCRPTSLWKGVIVTRSTGWRGGVPLWPSVEGQAGEALSIFQFQFEYC